MIDDTQLSYRVFGSPGADRLVVLVGTGMAVVNDPHPAETVTRDVCVLAVALDGSAIEDPGAFGSETPAEQTGTVLEELIRQNLALMTVERAEDALRAGIIAYRDGADVALRAAVALGETVDRVALVAVATPDQPLDRDDFGVLIGDATAETLILNGAHHESAAEPAAQWYADRLPSATVQIIDGQGELTLSDVWAQVLDFVAPGAHR